MRQSYSGHFALSCLTYVLIPLQIRYQVDLEFDEGFPAGTNVRIIKGSEPEWSKPTYLELVHCDIIKMCFRTFYYSYIIVSF